MPADSKIEFYHPNDYPYLTVCTTSSHGITISAAKYYFILWFNQDMSTLRGWWEEDRNKSQRFYASTLGNYLIYTLISVG